MKNWMQRPGVNDTLFYLFIFLAPGAAVLIPDVALYSLISPAFWRFCAASWRLFAVTYLLFLLIHAALTAAVRRVSVSAGILCLLSAAVGVANSSKLFYRGSPLLPGDIFALKDALIMVGKGFPAEISRSMAAIAAAVVLALVLIWPVRIPARLRGKTKKSRLLRSAAWVAVFVAAAVAYTGLVVFNDDVTDALGYRRTDASSDRSCRNTVYLEFFKALKATLPKVPDGYTQQNMEELGEDIASHRQTGSSATPDIVVVLAESWARVDEYDVTYDCDLFENYERLGRQGVTGLSVSPLFGGGTADMEFELLTGFTSNDTQISSTAFVTYLYDGFPGIGNYLRRSGYRTVALHAYTSELYNRANAYPMLGFDKVCFSDTFSDPELSGDYISDKSCVEQIIRLYDEAAAGGDPVFIHALTMQNHVPILADRYDPTEVVGCTSDTYSDEDLLVLAQYGTLLKKTDEAIGELADYFSTLDRPVILVVMGDHQAPLGVKEAGEDVDVLTRYGFYDTYDPATDFAEIHTTPYLVWTNYDRSLDGTTFGTLVPNRVLVDALGAYDVARPAYFDYIYSEYNAMNGATGNYVVDPDGKVSFEMTPEQQAEYEQRQLIQYDLIFGKKYLMDSIY
ncbi:MAG: LTA synthase family protein [Oscillospiraceae bacterium]|nr:LTA synthase family protein [Oscillospiraceae bacterium]